MWMMSARDIKAEEKSVNIVFLGTGTLVAGTGMSQNDPQSIHSDKYLQR